MRDLVVLKRGMGPALRQLDLLYQAGPTAGLSDEQLLYRFAARTSAVSAVAFEALVNRHGPMVLATCRGVLRNEHDAEDAFQATFLVLARRAESLRRRDRLGPWLHRVALRASEQARIAAARRRRREQHSVELSAMVEAGPERHAEREELRRAVHQEVDRLPERYRTVVVLCDLQGESYEAAAGRLRVPVGTVRSRLARARDRLRVRIDRRGLAVSAALAAVMAPEGARAAVPAQLLASTVKLATVAGAGRLAAASASTAALAYAQEVLRSRLLAGLGKCAAVAIVGAGLTVVGVELRAVSRPPAVAPSPAPTAPSSLAAEGRLPRDADTIQGRWIIDEAFQGGTALGLVLGDRLVVEGNRFHWTAVRGEPERIFRKGTTRGRITLDLQASPRRVNFVVSGRELPGGFAPAASVLGRLQDDALESGRSIPAIYRLEQIRSRLRLCVGDPDRPKSFRSDPGSQELLLVFRREDPGERRRPATADSRESASSPASESQGEFRP
jgi:RNA polymerase sigma factor (sigma-70 family)